MKLSLILLAAVAVAPFAVGCSAQTPEPGEVSEADVNAAAVAPGSFKLYGVPNADPNPLCDVHTSLTLSADGGSSAHLEEGLAGACEIFVIPNARDYPLTLSGVECGTKIYSGSFLRGIERFSVKITDNRTRLCENVIPALIVVEETRDGELGPITTTKFSHDKPAAQELTVEGELVSVAGIGGESTGFAIQRSEGLFELVLDDAERSQFIDGKKARVKGKLTLLSGVETHDRPAIDVTEMLVCPSAGHVNCMPGGPVPNLCVASNRTWVSANCAGVEFLD
jgi:hypothetical protein